MWISEGETVYCPLIVLRAAAWELLAQGQSPSPLPFLSCATFLPEPPAPHL